MHLKQSHKYNDKGLWKMPWQTSFASQLRPGRQHIWVVWDPGSFKAELVNGEALRWQLHQGIPQVDVVDLYLRGIWFWEENPQKSIEGLTQKSGVAVANTKTDHFSKLHLVVVFCLKLPHMDGRETGVYSHHCSSSGPHVVAIPQYKNMA